jgi:hypothetical protein
MLHEGQFFVFVTPRNREERNIVKRIQVTVAAHGALYLLVLCSTLHISQVRPQNFSLRGVGYPEAVHNLCLILKIKL